MQEHGEKGLPRFVMEAGVALLTGAFGVAVCYGSIEAGAGWTEMGPDAGYFPFYIGLLIAFGSLANLVSALVKHRGSDEIFVDAARFRAVLGFFLPLVAFAAVSTFLVLASLVIMLMFGQVIRQRQLSGLRSAEAH